jgi:hypothetical protein
MQAIQIAPGVDPYEVLETGNVLVLPDAPLTLSAEDRELIQGIRQSGGHHKNISYTPQQDKVSGLDQTAAPARERLHAILRRYSESAIESAARLLPRYRQRWSLDYASLRPIEEAGTKAAASRNATTCCIPTHFLHGPLAWRPDPAQFLEPASFQAARLVDFGPIRKPGRALRQWLPASGGLRAPRAAGRRTVLRRLGLPLADRSDYDEFMLAFHDYLKGNAEFQSNCPKYRLEFQPGAAWMAFTDVVPHAVESGQFAMEQTLIVPRDALAVPERAPIAILEKLAGRSLA